MEISTWQEGSTVLITTWQYLNDRYSAQYCGNRRDGLRVHACLDAAAFCAASWPCGLQC